jgi:methylmalonyl-CoA mutase cobalamin-binding subunit
MHLIRSEILPEGRLPDASEVLAQGRAAAKNTSLGANPFLKLHGVTSEAEFKRRCAIEHRIMQHAQVGFRDLDKSCRAYAEIYASCQAKGVTVDRYGLCLDWSMGYPPEQRRDRPKGTGLLLSNIEEFVRLTGYAPVAPHFGDFVLGMPAAFENTVAALCAGSTAIGNLGQYFTFRLPHWDDDVYTTEATLKALGLIAAQDVEILVHSNLDDGFAGLFCDLSCCLGAVLLEKYIVNGLVGARVSHCYGHHFSDPTRRMAFHLALSQISETPGTMIYGNTTQYRGGEDENYASLEAYLSVDIAGQNLQPSGHAINPVPVSENLRIPDIDEIIDAQLFAARLAAQPMSSDSSLDMQLAHTQAGAMVVGAINFQHSVMNGFSAAGIDIRNPFEMLLALKRVGGKKLEQLYGPGLQNDEAPRGRDPIVASTIVDEISELAHHHLKRIDGRDERIVKGAGLKVVTATTDVHEHGKLLLDRVLGELGVTTIDGGTSTDADDLAILAHRVSADAIAVSTYNGVALSFARELQREMGKFDVVPPVIFGGRLNQIPDTSNNSLPVDVSEEVRSTGASVCEKLEDVVPFLADIATTKSTNPKRII